MSSPDHNQAFCFMWFIVFLFVLSSMLFLKTKRALGRCWRVSLHPTQSIALSSGLDFPLCSEATATPRREKCDQRREQFYQGVELGLNGVY